MKSAIRSIIIGAFVSMCLYGGDAKAADITVNTNAMRSTAQGTALPGECSILDAYEAAKTDTNVGGCMAGDPLAVSGDTVILPAGEFDFSSLNISTPAWGEASLRGAGVD